MYSELIKALRNDSSDETYFMPLAADTIESLTAENAELRKDLCLSCGGYGGIDCEICKWKR